MTTRQVLFTATAEADLEDIVEYIAADAPAAAERAVRRLQSATARLARHAASGRWVPELDETSEARAVRELVVRPWRVLYRIAGPRVLVLAVLDSRRDLATLIFQRAATRSH